MKESLVTFDSDPRQIISERKNSRLCLTFNIFFFYHFVAHRKLKNWKIDNWLLSTHCLIATNIISQKLFINFFPVLITQKMMKCSVWLQLLCTSRLASLSFLQTQIQFAYKFSSLIAAGSRTIYHSKDTINLETWKSSINFPSPFRLSMWKVFFFWATWDETNHRHIKLRIVNCCFCRQFVCL